jgi:hypothetical protein
MVAHPLTIARVANMRKPRVTFIVVPPTPFPAVAPEIGTQHRLHTLDLRKIYANLPIRSFCALFYGFMEVSIFDGTIMNQMK